MNIVFLCVWNTLNRDQIGPLCDVMRTLIQSNCAHFLFNRKPKIMLNKPKSERYSTGEPLYTIFGVQIKGMPFNNLFRFGCVFAIYHKCRMVNIYYNSCVACVCFIFCRFPLCWLWGRARFAVLPPACGYKRVCLGKCGYVFNCEKITLIAAVEYSYVDKVQCQSTIIIAWCTHTIGCTNSTKRNYLLVTCIYYLFLYLQLVIYFMIMLQNGLNFCFTFSFVVFFMFGFFPAGGTF